MNPILSTNIKGITIAKALKLKNQVAAHYKILASRASSHNSHSTAVTPVYNTLEVIEEMTATYAFLIDLKTAIHAANVPMYRKVIELREIKGLITFYSSMSCFEGSHPSYNTKGEPTVETFVAAVNQRAVDQKIEALQASLSAIQDELDAFNAITTLN